MGREGLPRRLAGCYALYDQGGRPASERWYFASPYIRLDTIPPPRRIRADTAPAWLLARLGPDRQPVSGDAPELELLYWSATPLSDSVRMLIHSGFSGTELILGVGARADTLRGRAVVHWDFGPPFEHDAGGVTAVRVPCVPAAVIEPNPPRP